MLICPNCGASYASGKKFCGQCGARLPNSTPLTGLLPPNQMLQGQYLILKKLAQGGQSAVYLAADTLNNSTPVVIKEMSQAGLDPTEREQAFNAFLREATML